MDEADKQRAVGVQGQATSHAAAWDAVYTMTSKLLALARQCDVRVSQAAADQAADLAAEVRGLGFKIPHLQQNWLLR